MFPSLAARETYVAETNFAAQKQKMFLPGIKNIFASRTQILRPKHMFPSLATVKTMLTRFQCCSLSKNCLLSVLTTIKMAHCEEIEAGHAQKKGKGRERNWKDEEIEMPIMLYAKRPCLWDMGHKDYMKRDNLHLGLSFGFLHLRCPNKLLSYTIFLGFLLVECHVLIHLHALFIHGDDKFKHLSPDFFSLSSNAFVFGFLV